MTTAKAYILLDGEQRRASVSEWLGEAGFEATEAKDPRDLGRLCESDAPAVVMVEGPLGAGSGVEAIQWLRRGGMRRPVVFACGSRYESASLVEVDALGPYAAFTRFEADAVVQAARMASRTPTVQAPPAEGSLEDTDLSALLWHCLSVRFTGVVVLSSQGTTKKIYVHRGRPVYCSSSILSENFGQMLLRKGLITEIEYNWARKIQQREGIRQGEALVKIGVLTHEALFAYLRDQIREKILNGFAWGAGEYRLEESAESLHTVNHFRFNPVALLVEGRLRFLGGEEVQEAWDEAAPRWAVCALSATEGMAPAEDWLPIEVAEALRRPARLSAVAAGQGWGPAEALAVFDTLVQIGYAVTADHPEALPEAVSPEHAEPISYGVGDPGSVDVEDVAEVDEASRAVLSEELWGAYLRLTSANHFEALGTSPEADDAAVIQARDAMLETYSAQRFGPALDAPRLIGALKEIRTRVRVAAKTLLDPERRESYTDQLGGACAVSERDRYLSAEDAFVAGMSMLDEDPAAACRYFQRATQLNPLEATYTMYEGWSMYRSADTIDRRVEARGHITRAIAANPLLDDGYAFLAQIYRDEGDVEESCAQARTALMFNPTNPRAVELLTAAGHKPTASFPVSTSWL